MSTVENHVQLKPCPFCGSADIRMIESASYGSAVYLIACQSCFVRTERSLGQQSAVDVWNRRVGQPNESPFRNPNTSARSGMGLPKH